MRKKKRKSHTGGGGDEIMHDEPYVTYAKEFEREANVIGHCDVAERGLE